MNQEDILKQANDLDVALLALANGEIKIGKLPLEPIVKLIQFARETIAARAEPIGEIGFNNDYVHYLENDAGVPQDFPVAGTKVYLGAPEDKNAVKWEALKAIVGYVRGATDSVVTLFQDDATYEFFVKVNDKVFAYGQTLEVAVGKAYEAAVASGRIVR